MTWLTVAFCMAVSFIFSGIEAGVLSMNRVRLRHRVRQGDKAAQILEGLLTHTDRLLGTVIVVNNAGSMLALALILHFAWTEAGAVVAVLSVAACIPVFALVLEFLPRAVFRHFSYSTLVFFARLLQVTDRLLGPVVMPLVALLRILTGSIRRKSHQRINTLEQMKLMTVESADRGEIAADTRDFIMNTIAFRTVKATDLMIPMRSTVSVSPETSIEEVLQLARQTNIDRLPVVQGDGAVSGILQIFDLLIDGIATGRAQSYLRRVVTVNQNESGVEVLRKLRAARMSLAVVTPDEGKQPLGIISSEDLIQKMLRG